jgi:hypothetical protein
MSGNGSQLWAALPPYEVTDRNRQKITANLKAFEAAIRSQFNGDGVAIDSIYNLSRIIKVIGTRSIKGKNTRERPHRVSASLNGFERLEDAKLLDAICAMSAPVEKTPGRKRKGRKETALGGAISDRVLRVLSSSPRARALFEGRGKTELGDDGKPLDQSSSGYDFSLVLYLVNKGVTDSSELATVLFHRPDGRARQKGQSYIERTVTRALERAGVTGVQSRDQDGSLPNILVSDRELRDVTRDGLDAIMQDNEPPVVFQHGAAPARIHVTGEGTPRIEPLTQWTMRERLTSVADWRKEIPLPHGGTRVVSVSPPLDVVHNLLALPSWPFPAIDGVVESPTFAPDGELMTTPGYHPKAKLWVNLDRGLALPAVAPGPRKTDIANACDLLLNHLLGEFPFIDPASRANTLAVSLLPFVRQMIDGPTPLHLIDAPAPGTGKSLLGDAVVLPATGRPALVMTEGHDDEEWRKRLTAAMVQAPIFILLDNLRRRLDSSQLSAAITATTWTDRILGKTATTVLAVKNIWIATGNNVSLSNEMARRCVWIRLDAKVDQPWKRSGFRHRDLRAWAKHKRGELIWAALTLGQAWIAAGKPVGSQQLGNFESWVQTLGGILDVAGVPGFLENAQELYSRGDEETAEWRELVAQWWERFRDKQVQTQDLFQLATENDVLAGVLGDKGERSQKIRLGRALGRMRDRVVGSYRIEAGVRTTARARSIGSSRSMVPPP